ncbi:hypothetical protein L0657_12710 [Dyadobacter sp. CY345]|uniref:hypothetical protein n=1 Tax=Dyadobacter sp. CY345 TaxID=2909335 RepID=UPI001F3279E1|nr:hypothetical protein [Dyadobacter sp. CY345]MCF2444822.1 hypothetical protein [Dyadobacter sp. CY345]
MITNSEKDRLKYEIASTEDLLSKVGKSRIMAYSMTKKLEDLNKQLDELDNEEPEAKALLYFYGAPVIGSAGIETNFLSSALSPFQQLVTARVAKKWQGKVQKKGKMKDLHDSKLYLTALPRGSFGVELKKLTNQHIYHESHLADSLQEVVELIASSKDKNAFLKQIKNSAPRELSALKKFFRVLDKSDAGVKIETGHITSTFSQKEVKLAFEIISQIAIDSEDIQIVGKFRGILLDTWSFDFLDSTDKLIHGPIHPSVSEEEAAEFDDFLNLNCIATFEKTVTTKIDGENKPVFSLKSIDHV